MISAVTRRNVFSQKAYGPMPLHPRRNRRRTSSTDRGLTAQDAVDIDAGSAALRLMLRDDRAHEVLMEGVVLRPCHSALR